MSDTVNKATGVTTLKKVSEENQILASKNAEMEKKIEELQQQLLLLMEENKTKKEQESNIEYSYDNNISDEMYEEPNANKQIKVMSMFFGTLNLCNNKNRTIGKILTFTKFGQIKSVLYHDLVDYVNNERKFAENGYFYILDKAAVYSLGLSTEYEKLVDANIINNILNYNLSEMEAIVSNMTEIQQRTLINVLSNRLYNGETLDMNKIEAINRITNCNIQNIVKEKKDFIERAAKNPA